MDGDGSSAMFTVEDYRRTLERIERAEGDLRIRMASVEALKGVARLQHDFLVQAGLIASERPAVEGFEPYPRGMNGVLLVLLDFFPTPVDTRQLLERAQVCDAVDAGSPHGSSTLGTVLRRLASRGLAVKDGRRWQLTDVGHRAATVVRQEEQAAS